MTDHKLFFYSLTLPQPTLPGGFSGVVSPPVFYFATERQLELWRTRNPEQEKLAVFGMHEISLKCLKGLLRESQRKRKPRCQECGR